MKLIATLTACAVLTGCMVTQPITGAGIKTAAADLLERSANYDELRQLPAPAGRIPVAIYGFRDMTGQYKSQPSSNISTQVSQGAASMLVDAAMASGWFIALEREGLNNLLTERKIIRSNLERTQKNVALPELTSARVLLEGGIIGYDTSVMTGGSGARYLGVGGSTQYTVDQVTVSLRAVDIASGRVINNVTTTKTIFSTELTGSVFKYVAFQELLELEGGRTTNEPTQIALQSAIESAVAHLVAQGLTTGSWSLADPADMNDPVLGQLFESARQSGQFFGG